MFVYIIIYIYIYIYIYMRPHCHMHSRERSPILGRLGPQAKLAAAAWVLSSTNLSDWFPTKKGEHVEVLKSSLLGQGLFLWL